MRYRVLPLLAALASIPCACSSDKSAADAGGAVFSYSPQGCAYSVTPPDTRGFTDLALDDGSPVDPTSGAPQRVRVGLGGGTTKGQAGYADPTTSAAFTWETAASFASAHVRLGTTADALSDVRPGYSWTTPPPTVGLSSGQPAYMHEAHACGLKPGTTYFYQVGGGASGSEVWSATQSFATLPASGKVTLGVLGDARDKVATWQLVHSRMREAGVPMQLVSGDVVDIGTLENLYTQWLDAIWHDPNDATKFLTLGQQMILPVAGNHENEASQFFANFAIPGDGPYAETFASFDVGSAHVVLLDDQAIASQPGGDQANAQLAWLDADLAAAEGDRAAHPFVVVVEHRGLFSTATHASDTDVIAARAALAPVYDKHKVDLVVTGHDHEFERSKPLTAGNPPSGAPVVGQGTTYVICAGAGADAYSIGTTPVPYRDKSVQFGKGTPYEGVYGLLELDAHSLTLRVYGLKSAGGGIAGDDVIDTFQLTR